MIFPPDLDTAMGELVPADRASNLSTQADWCKYPVDVAICTIEF